MKLTLKLISMEPRKVTKRDGTQTDILILVLKDMTREYGDEFFVKAYGKTIDNVRESGVQVGQTVDAMVDFSIFHGEKGDVQNCKLYSIRPAIPPRQQPYQQQPYQQPNDDYGF